MNCYLYIATAATRSNAQAACVAKNMRLVSYDSLSDQQDLDLGGMVPSGTSHWCAIQAAPAVAKCCLLRGRTCSNPGSPVCRPCERQLHVSSPSVAPLLGRPHRLPAWCPAWLAPVSAPACSCLLLLLVSPPLTSDVPLRLPGSASATTPPSGRGPMALMWAPPLRPASPARMHTGLKWLPAPSPATPASPVWSPPPQVPTPPTREMAARRSRPLGTMSQMHPRRGHGCPPYAPPRRPMCARGTQK
jgi:hypothetical protein